VEQGCLVQITAASLLGELGRPARKAAERFLKSGLVDIVASDAHSPTGARRPRFAPALKRLRRLVGEEKTFELLCGCPGRLVGALSGGPLRQRRGAASR